MHVAALVPPPPPQVPKALRPSVPTPWALQSEVRGAGRFLPPALAPASAALAEALYERKAALAELMAQARRGACGATDRHRFPSRFSEFSLSWFFLCILYSLSINVYATLPKDIASPQNHRSR